MKCSHHKGLQLAYAVCKHVANGASVAMFTEATKHKIGSIGCVFCQAAPDAVEADDLLLICGACCAASGWLPN